MDTANIISIVVSIVSIVISVIFAFIGIIFSLKSDKTLSTIQKEVNIQSQQYMHLLEISIQSENEKWSEARKSENEKWSQLTDLWRVSMEVQSSSKSKVDPNSLRPIPRKSKLTEINNEEKL